jgi:cell division protein FtsZ
MKGAKGLLISITGGKDLTLYEVDEAATRIREEVDQDANIIVGATFDESLDGIVRVSVVATGIDVALSARQPVHTRQPVVAGSGCAGRSTAARRPGPAGGRGGSRLAELTQSLRANTQRMAETRRAHRPGASRSRAGAERSPRSRPAPEAAAAPAGRRDAGAAGRDRGRDDPADRSRSPRCS